VITRQPNARPHGSVTSVGEVRRVQYSGLKTGAVVSSETSKASTNTKQRYRSLTFYSETSVSLTVPIAAIKTTF